MIFKFKSSEIKMILKCKIEEEKNINHLDRLSPADCTPLQK